MSKSCKHCGNVSFNNASSCPKCNRPFIGEPIRAPQEGVPPECQSKPKCQNNGIIPGAFYEFDRPCPNRNCKYSRSS